MTLKHFMWVVSIVVGIVAMAAGVAVLVNRFLVNKDNEEYEFIECDEADDSEKEEKAEKTEQTEEPKE